MYEWVIPIASPTYSSKPKNSNNFLSVYSLFNLKALFWFARMPFTQNAFSSGTVLIHSVLTRYSVFSGVDGPGR
jgi:hypothetical protein